MNTQILTKLHSQQFKKVPELRPGDTVRVHQKIKEGNKERVQIFEGVVLRVKGGGLNQTFLVRKISFGIGVEKNFLIHSPNIAKIEVKRRAKVRQGYLGYLRNLTGKSARLKDKQFDMLAVNVKEEEPEVVEEVALEDVEKAEAKEAASEDEKLDETPNDSQEAEIAEVVEGLEKADKDLGKGKGKEGERAEKVTEELSQEDIKEEIEQEKESEK